MNSSLFVLLACLAMAASTPVRERGVLPTSGPIPQECCRVFCPPKAVCICCFVDYEYYDGEKWKSVNGVPRYLMERYANRTLAEANAAGEQGTEAEAPADFDG